MVSTQEAVKLMQDLRESVSVRNDGPECGWCGERPAVKEVRDLRPNMNSEPEQICLQCLLEAIFDDDNITDEEIAGAMTDIMSTSRLLRVFALAAETESSYVERLEEEHHRYMLMTTSEEASQ